MEITLRGRDADVVVSADVDEPPNGQVPETLAREVVTAIADDVSFDGVAGRAAVRFTKRPGRPDDGAS